MIKTDELIAYVEDIIDDIETDFEDERDIRFLLRTLMNRAETALERYGLLKI